MLADYMAASEQARRTILTKCKYPPKAPVIQHKDAQESISRHLSSACSYEDVVTRIETLRSGLQATPFDVEVAENNADYLEQYLQTAPALPAQIAETTVAGKLPPLQLEGFTLSCSPHLLFKRVNRRNVPKVGLGFLRYAKGKALAPDVADWQGAIILGYLQKKLEQGVTHTDPDRQMCLTIDVWTGAVRCAPTNAVYRFNEVMARCAGIAQQWHQIPAPAGAVY